MTKRIIPLAAACIAVLAAALPAAAKTPPPTVVAKVHSLEAATLKNNKSAATKAYGQIQTKTPRLTAIVSSFKTKCR